MQRIKPIGLNLRKTDYEIEDGFLQECINVQWRDNALRPIPKRLTTNIDVTNTEKYIMHKVGDENIINVLAFSSSSGKMEWIGTITDGVYTQKIPPVAITGVKKTAGMSYVIQNGLIYFMGDGSSESEQYYVQVKYLESNSTYEVKDLYSWKDDTAKFNTDNGELLFSRINTETKWNMTFTNGVVLVRFALVLDTGDVVMHSAIYPHAIKGFFYVEDTANPGTITTLKNIHTCIEVSPDDSLASVSSNVVAVNVYATIPYYESEYDENLFTGDEYIKKLNDSILINAINGQIDTPFYLLRSVDVDKLDLGIRLYLYADKDNNFAVEGFTSGAINTDYHIDITSIAAGEIMPVDSFTWHKLFGRLTSYNGRLVIEKPTTILNQDIWDYNSLYNSTVNAGAKTAFTIDTEDGIIKSAPYLSGKMPVSIVGDDVIKTKTILCYPDYRTTRLLFNGYDTVLSAIRPTGSSLYAFDMIKKTSQNVACNIKDIDSTIDGDYKFQTGQILPYVYFTTALRYHLDLNYHHTVTESRSSGTIPGYTSNNRIQFTEAGQFSTFPVENSYRIGEGSIMSVGSNSIVPNETFVVAPLIVGTSDGVYSMNTDPSGNNFIASITKIANIPYISPIALQIGNSIIFVSDKGLMSIGNDGIQNLTEKFFPDYGNGNFPAQNSIYVNYNTLTLDFFGIGGNEIEMIDIVQYMKGAIFAFDSRRENLWCCNSSTDYSLIYNLTDGLWTMTDIVFTEAPELFSIYNKSNDEIYSRYLIKNSNSNYLELLSGEDDTEMVKFHLLTRPIKLQAPDDFKKINRLYARCEIFDNAGHDGYFVFGVWGKQDTNKTKVSIPLVAIKGSESSNSMSFGIRQDIPIGRLAGKYKTITVLMGGKASPDSSINAFDFNASIVNNNINR